MNTGAIHAHYISFFVMHMRLLSVLKLGDCIQIKGIPAKLDVELHFTGHHVGVHNFIEGY